MGGVIFETGERHQEAAAIWARRRLADKAGRRFRIPNDQDGVLFADSVGLGKTWEALSAAALILYKQRPKAGRRHVLVLCPANLVTKWEDELGARSPFREKLSMWQKRLKRGGAEVSAKRVVETLTHVLPIRSSRHVQTRLKRGRFRPSGGTYIVSQSLITRHGRGLAALRRENWDIVIVDEAHNSSARKALKAIETRRRVRTKLLLTATPFQLEPRQFNDLARHLLKHGHRVLSQPQIASYISQVAEVFESPEKSGPKRQDVRAVSITLRKLAARTVPRTPRRRYEILMLDGKTKQLPVHLNELDDVAMRQLLDDLRHGKDDAGDREFEIAYFNRRLDLAAKMEVTYVANTLRRFLATGTSECESPRRCALSAWAVKSIADDLRLGIREGKPRKMIVFTSWVGDPNRGEAASLKRILQEAFGEAVGAVKHGIGEHQWNGWAAAGAHRFNAAAAEASRIEVRKALAALAEDEATNVMAGKHVRLVRQIAKTLEKKADAIEEAKNELSELEDKRSFEARSIRRRVRDMQSAMSPRTTGNLIGPVERYTGGERRSARDRAATAFREVGPPWVLVASNVGAEGIDLHTYTSRIVHYDLEWNPAKMEQREGRGDRVGRLLKEKLAIVYCVVPRTYDERMLYQLVARDRWHGVLLGKPAGQLRDETSDAPLIDRKRLGRIRLDLKPRAGR